jgi:hypothetical protein
MRLRWANASRRVCGCGAISRKPRFWLTIERPHADREAHIVSGWGATPHLERADIAVGLGGTVTKRTGFDGKGFGPFTPALAGNPVVLDNDPSSLINLVLNGSNPLVVRGTPDPYRMPQFRAQYSDQEIADVVTFIRNGWGNKALTVTAEQVAKLRKTTDPTSDQVIILRMR